jgi:hypothetical protein
LIAASVCATPSAQATEILTFSGSAAVDYRFISGPRPPSNPSSLGITALNLEVAAKVVAEIGHGVSFTVKACGGCHGIELDQAYGELRVRDELNVRVGRINVPFGEFNVRHDPANFSTPSKPLMYAMGDMLQYGPDGFNLGIVPAPYVDNGVELLGSFSLGGATQLDYSLYVVKGLAGSNDFDFAYSRRYLDNNALPSFGGRLVLTGENWAVGASGTGGTYDDRDKLWYVMAGLDTYARVGPVTLRAEAAGRRTDIDPTATGYPYQVVDPWFLKLGWYVQVDVALHPRLTLVVRSDGLHRLGMPIPGSSVASSAAGVQRQTIAALGRITENLALKLDYELWTFSGVDYPLRHMARAVLVFAY